MSISDDAWLHSDSLLRERVIRDYVKRNLDPESCRAFEAHYMGCGECFADLRAASLIVAGLGQNWVQRREDADVTVIEFTGPAMLVRASAAARQFEGILHDGDSRVLIDMSQVTRIDSAGLAQLISCYSHVLRRRGMLKVLCPNPVVRQVLRLSRLDGIIEAFDEESDALRSFSSSSPTGPGRVDHDR